MTETPIADATQRETALDTRRSFIVQAPAGSGKTELLTQRYLALLGEVAHPEEIYAITFTRKAAAEMRNRILAALESAAGPQPREPHRRLTWGLARAALAQDARHDWHLARDPNRLRVQTFDSLSNALARQLPLLSALGAAPAVTEDAAAHYREAARATLRLLEDAALGPHIARLLTHLDNRQALLEDLLTGLLARRDQWLGHALRSPDGDELDRALGEAVVDHLARLRDACPRDWLHRLVVVAHDAASRLGGAQAATALAEWKQRTDPPDSDWAALPAWQGLAQLLLTGKGEPRRSWDARSGFPAPSERGIDAHTRSLRQQAKDEIAALTAALAERPDLLRDWAGLRVLPRHTADPAQHAVLGSLLRVSLQAALELRLAFQQAGEVDFAEIQLRAQQALGEPDAPTDLALSLDYRVRHLLVDEFQDTSSGQYRLLATLTAGWQDGDGRTLFAVGDPMQSIYRFREAEVGLYLAARERGIGGLRLDPLTLQVNFRSTAAIVDWVNRGFPTIMPDAVDVGRGAVPYTAATAFDRGADPAAVQVHAFAGADPAAEADRVVDLVRTALTETADGQIAVLARARSHLHAIAAALNAAGLAFQAVEVDPLAQRPVVQDLHMLTRALLHPADRLAWLVVLHAPWLGLALPDLLVLTAAGGCLPERLREPRLRASLSDDGRGRVERLLAALGDELPARGRRPLRQWVESIWLRLGGAAVAGSTGAADAQAYLALLDRHAEARGLIDFTRIEAALAGLYAGPDGRADGRVQLMTMHKSKGLEFDTVILPGLGRRPRGSDSRLLYWLEQTGRDGRPRLLMAPIRAVDDADEPISGYLRELERDKDRLETARLLYVAATRARRRLHLLGHVAVDREGAARGPAADSLLAHLWPVLGPHFEDLPLRPPAPEGPPSLGLATLSRLAADWRPALAAPTGTATAPTEVAAAIEFDWAGDTARHVGTLVHRHLERIALDGVEHWPVERAASLQPVLRRGLGNLGVAPNELEAATAKTLRALSATLGDDTGRWILGAHAEARCEWPLTLYDEVPRHLVIDRTFVDAEGVRWIVDYKTGEHLDGDRAAFLDREYERYREQLETYARVVRGLDPRPIRLALYFPLFADWRVWDYQG